ncbi:MAG TPA: hypothetical protein VF574_18760 [Allosphingosinicella sp.]|jgi:hypothetical protein
MTDGLRLDGRREKALREEMLRRAAAMLSDDGQTRPPGEVASALIGAAARIGEEVTRRLDRVPGKQVDNLFGAMGIGGDPARPARVPVAFRLADPAPAGLVAPAATRLMASGEAGGVVFETDRTIALAPGSISALVAIDAGRDEIFLPPDGVIDPALPREPVVERALRSGAGAGADKLQISLAAGLAPGTILSIGADNEAVEHRIVALEDDLVTIDPPLERTVDRNTKVAIVQDFAPFGGHRNRQVHTLYLGHEALLDLPSALSIVVTGLTLPETPEWSWWGGEEPAWQTLTPAAGSGGLVLAKTEGQPVAREIAGRESLWLRARLPAGSAGSARGSDIRLAVVGSGGDYAQAAEVEAIANTTPLVVNSAFHPFGREPRLFDSFYIGCAEAFSKPDATVRLDFEFAGPELGPLAAVSLDGVSQIFGVGKDGLLYRAELGGPQPRLLAFTPSREARQNVPVPPHAPIAVGRNEKTVLVAIGATGAVHLVQTRFDAPLEPASVTWKTLLLGEDEADEVTEVAFSSDDGELVLLAATKKGNRLTWSKPQTEAPPVRTKGPGRRVVQIQGAAAALVIDPPSNTEQMINFHGMPGGPVKVKADWLPIRQLAAWAALEPPDAGKRAVFLAGYDTAGVLRVMALSDAATEPVKVAGATGTGPIGFAPPPQGAAPEAFPTLLLAGPESGRWVWRGAGYRAAGGQPSLESSGNQSRHFVSTPNLFAVHRASQGLLYRPAARGGRWAEEYDVPIRRTGLGLVNDAPATADYAAAQKLPAGTRLDIVRSSVPGRALLLPVAGMPPTGAARLDHASFFKKSAIADGPVAVENRRVLLIDDKALEAGRQAGITAEAKSKAWSDAQAEQEVLKAPEKEAREKAEADRARARELKGIADGLDAKANGLRESAEAARRAFDAATAARVAAEQHPPRAVGEAAEAVRRAKEEESSKEKIWQTANQKAVDSQEAAAKAKVEAEKAAPGTDEARALSETAAQLSAEADRLRQVAADAHSAFEQATASRIAAEGEQEAALAAAEGAAKQLEEDEGEKRQTWLTAKQRAEEAEAAAAEAQAQAGQADGKAVEAENAHEEALRKLTAAEEKVEDALRDKIQAEQDRVERLAKVELDLADNEVDVLLKGSSAPFDAQPIWHLRRNRKSDKGWAAPDELIGALGGKEVRYEVLAIQPPELPVAEAVEIDGGEELRAHLAQGNLRSEQDPALVASPATVEQFEDRWILPFPASLVEGDAKGGQGHILLTSGADDWTALGPAQPPNPALSWEYWNGTSWWALDHARLADGTANLLVDGIVSFDVPEDFAEGDVGGRTNYWIRARLVGGDYGEAKMSVKSVPAPGGETRQTVERDMSTIRPPYVTSLHVGFSARKAHQPQLVLAEDSLGLVDQTPANLAGLEFELFMPVGAEMNPAGAPAPPFERGLMIGFAKPVRGDPVSLYVDAAPGGVAATLIAETYRDGRFERVQIRDETRGLSEPGMILLSLPRAPDQAELFGTAAHWVRLGPSEAAAGWLPRIRGVHLNAAYADSVETRELESLGHSSGIPAQTLGLAGAPVDAGSLDLRVAEPLGEEDLLSGTLDVVATAGTKAAHWVRWSEVEDFSAGDGGARVFLLDAKTGQIRFGDGRRGAIPPLGAELLAMRYRCVAGEAGNKVAPGAAIQLVSPLASVERVTVLDVAAGGSDAETGEQARRRGTAKLRHGDRIITLADLEDYVLARSPAIAQVCAANRGGTVRLVVAAKGPEPRPGPAMLRALERSVREAAGYGVARSGGVDVVAPRLLPLRITLTLDPDDPDKYIEMADSAAVELVKLFDQAAGGFDGQGWPIGRAPVASDIAAALEPVGRFGMVSIDVLERADRREREAFPPSIPSDVLVRLDPTDIVCERRAEEVA